MHAWCGPLGCALTRRIPSGAGSHSGLKWMCCSDTSATSNTCFWRHHMNFQIQSSIYIVTCGIGTHCVWFQAKVQDMLGGQLSDTDNEAVLDELVDLELDVLGTEEQQAAAEVADMPA